MGSTLIGIFVFVVLLLIIRAVASVAMKILGVCFVLLAAVVMLYYFGLPPFKKNHVELSHLREKYCEKQNQQAHICNCIVNKLESDISMRFEAHEQNRLQRSRLDWAYVMHRSLGVIKPESMQCLKQVNAEADWQVFIHDLFAIDNSLYNQADSFVSRRKKQLSELKEDQMRNLKNIDERYLVQ